MALIQEKLSFCSFVNLFFFSKCFLYHLKSRIINTFLLSKVIRYNKTFLWVFALKINMHENIFFWTSQFHYSQLNTIICNNSYLIFSLNQWSVQLVKGSIFWTHYCQFFFPFKNLKQIFSIQPSICIIWNSLL